MESSGRAVCGDNPTDRRRTPQAEAEAAKLLAVTARRRFSFTAELLSPIDDLTNPATHDDIVLPYIVLID